MRLRGENLDIFAALKSIVSELDGEQRGNSVRIGSGLRHCKQRSRRLVTVISVVGRLNKMPAASQETCH